MTGMMPTRSMIGLRAVLGACITGPCLAGPPVMADGLVHELKLGVLDHDMPNMWSGFRAERNSADINVEALFSPSMGLFGGTLRPAFGASISTQRQTSNVYLDARWQYELPSRIFFVSRAASAMPTNTSGLSSCVS